MADPIVHSMKGRYCLIALPPGKGAMTSTCLASSPEVKDVTGSYFVNNQAVASSLRSYDEIVARRLWDITVQITGIDQ